MIGSAGEIARPTNQGKRVIYPQTPRGAHPCREACMPPLQTPGTAYTNPKTFPQSEHPRAATMRPVPICPTMPFLRRDGVRSMRRGGIYAARERYGTDHSWFAWCVTHIVGRGLDPPHIRGGRERPPYKPGETGNEPGTPRGAHPCREACMPPLQMRVTAYTPQKRYPVATAHGPQPCGPYHARYTPCKP